MNIYGLISKNTIIANMHKNNDSKLGALEVLIYQTQPAFGNRELKSNTA